MSKKWWALGRAIARVRPALAASLSINIMFSLFIYQRLAQYLHPETNGDVAECFPVIQVYSSDHRRLTEQAHPYVITTLPRGEYDQRSTGIRLRIVQRELGRANTKIPRFRGTVYLLDGRRVLMGILSPDLYTDI